VGGDGATLDIVGNIAVAEELGWYALDTRANVTVTIAGDIMGSSNVAAVYTGGWGANYTVRGALRCSGEDGYAIESNSSDEDTVRVSGDIYVQGAHDGDDTTMPGLFPILGGWCKIAGEELRIHILDDSNFPTTNLGEVVEYSGAGGGPTIPSEGILWPPR